MYWLGGFAESWLILDTNRGFPDYPQGRALRWRSAAHIQQQLNRYS
jgi:hypothetical protein